MKDKLVKRDAEGVDSSCLLDSLRNDKGPASEKKSVTAFRKRRAKRICHNRRVDQLQRNFDKQRRTPMKSMVAWSEERGVILI